MINKNYKYFCNELKRLKDERFFADSIKDELTVEDCNSKINELIRQMKENCNAFSKISENSIKTKFSKKASKILLNEKKKYEKASKILDRIENGDITDDDINKLIKIKSNLTTKLKIVATGTALVGMVILTLIGGKKISNKKSTSNYKDNETNIEAINGLQGIKNSIKTANNQNMNYDYSEKEGVTISFSDQKEESKEETTEEQNEINNDYKDNSHENDNKKVTKEEKEESEEEKTAKTEYKKFEKEIKGYSKTEEFETPTDEYDREDEKRKKEEKDQDYDEEQNNDDKKNPNEDNIDSENNDEKHEDIVIEEPAPAIPDDTPTEETPDATDNDEEYYDNQENKDDNTSSDNNQETKEDNNESNNSVISDSEDPAPAIPNDTPIEETPGDSKNDEEYYDGNKISKEEWDKLEKELTSDSLTTTKESSKLAVQKEKLQQQKVALENSRTNIDDNEEIKILENDQVKVLAMKI